MTEAGSGNGVEETGSDEGSDDGEADDDFELWKLPKQSGAHEDSHNGSDVQKVLNDDLGQSQSDTPEEDNAKPDQEPQITAELAAGAVADHKESDALQTSISGHKGAEVTLANDDTRSRTPVRRSTQAGAGQHSNPHHLPRPVMREGMGATAIDPQILNSVAQSNLLITELLAKNAQV